LPKTVKTDRSAERWIQEENLRGAEVAFVTDHQRLPLAWWWERICAPLGIDFERVRERAEKGNWHGRREEFWGAVHQEVLRRSKHRAVKDRLKELDQIHQVRADILDVITPKMVNGRKVYPVAPSTYEGMVGAFVKIDQLADLKRTAILSAIEPQLTNQTESPAASSRSGDLTPLEAEKIADLLLSERLQAQQQREQLDLPPKEPVVDGADDDENED
jgi:hypothetical protein